MAGKSKKDYPLKVIASIPKGHPMGLSKRDFSRQTLHKTKASADTEVAAYERMGIKSQTISR